MAISINHVYRTVLAFLNKEQRGFLTPEQFNRFAKMAQLELIDQAFVDYNRNFLKQTVAGFNSEYGDLSGIAQEKLDALAKESSLTFSTGVAALPGDLYKIVQITTGSARETEVEKIKKTELSYLNSSKLTAPDSTYPVYYLENDNIKIFPTSISSGLLDYIKKPTDPNWAYTGGGSSAYTYDSNASKDFEIHESEEPALIKKILAYAGLVIKDPTVIQMAQAEQASDFNKENV